MRKPLAQQEVPAATILVAQDNWASLRPLSDLLQDEGYRVVCVADCAQALEVLGADQIDLAFLDVMMPEIVEVFENFIVGVVASENK